jgi:hypothetical protein
MEYKAKLPYKIFFGIIGLSFIVLPFWSIVDGSIFTKKLWFIILYFILSPILIILGIDELYQIFRIIVIDGNNIKLKLFGKTIKEENINTIEYNNKHYGIRYFSHMSGSIKSIIINNKYFSFVSKMDNNYEEIRI